VASLQARRKRIIKSINDAVQLFNENNKAVREASKAPKTEREVVELIERNAAIIKTAVGIEFRLTAAKTFAGQIDKRLDVLCNPMVENLRKKYFEKNGLIDDCDDLFDKCQQLIKQNQSGCETQLEEVAEILRNLDAVSPLNNPSPPGSDDSKQEFVERLQALQQQGYALRDKIEDMQMECDNKGEKLRTVVTPLSELEEREVTTLEVRGVKRDEEALLRDLQAMNTALIPQEKEI
jgi:DNA repair exonuclease SbcCD ATPase subunit